MRLIGRLKETAILNQIVNSKKAEFVAIYGRRRVGKTFLIRQLLAKKGVYLECTGIKDGNLQAQLINFTQQFSNVFYPGIALKTAESWRRAFELLTVEIKKISTKHKVIVFFDELPWLATSRSQLMQNLDYFWNTEWSQLSHFKLIVCGSAASWMLNHLINAKGGLYNRVTKTIRLNPFTLEETKMFLAQKKITLSEKSIVDLYLVIGGVPFYLDQLDQTKSLSSNINHICFSQEGLLLNEFDRLFKSLFNHSDNHIKILREIAKTRYGISFKRLTQKLAKTPGGRFSEYLNELIACGFIQKFIPYGKKKRDTYYRVIDEYSLFFLKWIEPVLAGQYTLQGTNYWQTVSHSPGWYSWAGMGFEMVVFKHLDRVIKALDLEKTGCLVSHWQYQTGENSEEKGAQIDLVIDRNDSSITLCEIKYTAKPFTIDKDCARILMRKIEAFTNQTKTKKQLFFAMITASGLKTNVWSKELIQSAITIEDLF